MRCFHHLRTLAAWLLPVNFFLVIFLVAPVNCASLPSSASEEYFGKLDGELVAYPEDLDQVVFKPFHDQSKVKFSTPLESGATISAARLYNPLQGKSTILAVLVEPDDDSEPYLYADLNSDNVMDDNERIQLKREEGDHSSILDGTLKVPFKSTLFQSYPILIQYYKGYKQDDMREGERLVLQSKEAFARGHVDIKGRNTLVQYSFNPQSKKISVSNGLLGVDVDGDGDIVVDRFSPESADARNETVVFRIGDDYVSTRRIDIEKNQIIMRAHSPSDYKRIEIQVGSEVPDFQFTDFNNKKRRVSEFKGKYLLVDFWAMWCGPCRRELPYQRVAYANFQARGFEILGMNNDEDPEMIKAVLKKNSLNWTQATMDSIKTLEAHYRIHLFPTSFLIGPDGKIALIDQHKMRGQDLLKTLNRILPR